MTAPKSVSTPLPRRAARRDRNPPATAIGSARDAPSTSDRTGAATRHSWAMLGGPAFGVGEEGPDLGKRTLVDAPTAERHREQRVEIANGGEREPGFLQRLPCRRARAREQHAHAVDFRRPRRAALARRRGYCRRWRSGPRSDGCAHRRRCRPRYALRYRAPWPRPGRRPWGVPAGPRRGWRRERLR